MYIGNSSKLGLVFSPRHLLVSGDIFGFTTSGERECVTDI